LTTGLLIWWWTERTSGKPLQKYSTTSYEL
jgi:hypothetical protein